MFDSTRRWDGALALSALAALAIAAVAATPAAANMAAPPPPARVSGLATAGGSSPLAVKSADLVIDCGRGVDACAMKVTYQLHNPTSDEAGGVGAFYAVDTEDVTVAIDGTLRDDLSRGLDAEAFDRLVIEAAGDGAVEPERLGDRLGRHGVPLMLAAGASTEVVVTGTIHPRARPRYYLGRPAAAARHRLLVRGGRSDRRVRLTYLVAPIRTWSAFPATMTVTLVHPAAWGAQVDALAGAAVTTERGVTTRRGTIATAEVAELSLELALSAPEPIHAGVVLGVGGHVDDATGLRLRGAVEAGRGAYLASVAVEVERADDATGVVVVPAVTVASPWVLIVPSIGLGLGVPVRVRPDVDVGARFSADAQFGPLGLLMALDYYPGMDAGPQRFTVALLGQLSL